MRRKIDWRPALLAYMQATAPKPFIWGEHDCALFAAGAVEAMTGEDFAAPYRGRYTTLLGGLRVLRRDGFTDQAALAASLFEEIPPAMAGVGDIAVVPEGEANALGVVQGPRIYVVGPDVTGIGTVDLLRASRAFRIPHS